MAPFANAATTYFSEGFESPPVTPGTTAPQAPGAHTYDNAGWVITSAGEYGVFLNNIPTYFTGTTSQDLGFGGGNSAGPDEAAIEITGLTGVTDLKISFDALSIDGIPGDGLLQGLLVEVTDPNNFDMVLYTSGNIFGGAAVSNISFASPSGDSVELTISQVGPTTASDTGIDNIKITGVPEPSALLLLGLGGLAVLRRQRK